MSIPANREAEEAVLGALLCGAPADPDLRAEDLYYDGHRTIYRAIRRLEKPDALTVVAELERRGELEAAGGKAYVHELATVVPMVGNAAEYARLIRVQAQLREAQTIGRRIAEVSDLDGELATLVQRLEDVANSATPARSLDVMTAKAVCELPDPPNSDELLGPLLTRGGRLVLGAHTGEGKTTASLWIVRAITAEEQFIEWKGAGGRALVIDAEQGLRSIKRALSEVDLDSSEEVDYVRAPGGLNLDGADAPAVEELLRTGDYDVLLADPLYKLHSGDSNDERQAVDLMRRLDGWRERYGLALILPVHCRKPPPQSRFSMHDLFGSTAYLRGAEVVLGLQRLGNGYARLHFFKDRDGDLPVGERWSLLFDREKGFTRDPKDSEPTARERIRDLLEAQPGMTLDEIQSATGNGERTVRDALRALGAEGTETKPKRWQLPVREDTLWQD